MPNGIDREFLSPFPRPFMMNALQYLTVFELSAEKQKRIVIKNLEYMKNCAQEELNLINAIISELNNLESKG